ncbi:unnamed protein product [Prorocentrum cordatum]|uniref:Uncharacterized protein n=1 Tax=Prorocentrum cordatum TaxID=2364126 RepID=A0ABN9Y4H9_9DINO|nr:unnamed protein product [Polarella glacialis]|mmetsp:Transcript_74145/g.193434  ORF Transcript_74145/g.193434 Transcript_74145/m.193434 type:complete len:186 (+) Transcript_74145:84-641(+)
MALVLLAAAALLARTSLAGRGNVDLEVRGGAHVKAVKAHQSQEMSEIRDLLRELQERVDRLEAAHNSSESLDVRKYQTACSEPHNLYLEVSSGQLWVVKYGAKEALTGNTISQSVACWQSNPMLSSSAYTPGTLIPLQGCYDGFDQVHSAFNQVRYANRVDDDLCVFDSAKKLMCGGEKCQSAPN